MWQCGLMPLGGLFSFLQDDLMKNIFEENCVNALYQAFFISTLSLPDKLHVQQSVSMPYVGLSSFLPTKEKENIKMSIDVSMPYIGRSSFLLWHCYTRNCIDILYQCPISGVLHFYCKNIL